MTNLISDPRLRGISPAGMAGSYSGGSLPRLPNVNLKPVTVPATGGQTTNPMNINRAAAAASGALGGLFGNPRPYGPSMLPGFTQSGIGSLEIDRSAPMPTRGVPAGPQYAMQGGSMYQVNDPTKGLRQETYTKTNPMTGAVNSYYVNPRLAPNHALMTQARLADPSQNYKMAGGSLMAQSRANPAGMWNPIAGAAGPVGAGSNSSRSIFPMGGTGGSMTGMRPGATSPPATSLFGGGGQPTGGGYIRPGTALGGPFQIGGSTMNDPVIQRFQMLADQLGIQQQDEERALRDRLAASGRDPASGGGLMKGLMDNELRFNAARSGLLGGLLNEDESRALEFSLGNMQAQASRYGSDKNFAAAQLANQLGQSRLAEERRQYNTGFPLQTLGTLGPLLLGLGQFGQGGISGLAGSLGGAQSAFPTLY